MVAREKQQRHRRCTQHSSHADQTPAIPQRPQTSSPPTTPGHVPHETPWYQKPTSTSTRKPYAPFHPAPAPHLRALRSAAHLTLYTSRTRTYVHTAPRYQLRAAPRKKKKTPPAFRSTYPQHPTSSKTHPRIAVPWCVVRQAVVACWLRSRA